MVNQHDIHVAYADDHEIVRKGIMGFIHEWQGIHLDVAVSNGKQLIQYLEKTEILPDICILDVNMPEKDGFATIIELKKKWPDIKVLILTVFDLEIYIARMIKYGANGYLLKSCDPDEIQRALISINATGMYFSQAITKQYIHNIQTQNIKLFQLTAKETQVLKWTCSDFSYREIAEQIGTTTRSVDGHRDSLFRKLHVNNRVSLATLALQFGLVTMEINTVPPNKKVTKRQKRNL